MDSGKTSLITQTLQENDFGIGSRSLIIACEDGDEEYDEEALAKDKITVVAVESEEEFTEEYLKECDDTIKPDQVFIEYNGTWESAKILEMKLPKGWEIVQSLATVDASTFELYLTNMRAMMMEQVFNTDVVIFNRCTDDTPKAKFRRTIKAVNRRAQIVYEREVPLMRVMLMSFHMIWIRMSLKSPMLTTAFSIWMYRTIRRNTKAKPFVSWDLYIDRTNSVKNR